MATGRPIYGDRFHTANEEAALLARGFRYGTAPGALVIGWNGRHTAVTLPDGTPVSSGEGGGVKVGGGGAYQPQFTHHMYLPVEAPEGEVMPEARPRRRRSTPSRLRRPRRTSSTRTSCPRLRPSPGWRFLLPVPGRSLCPRPTWRRLLRSSRHVGGPWLARV